ncbi:Clavaminate synthase-like protein [Trametes versicolor FP-101664 SS1]|uniref:Clavaminate synthase-like protein n=1 Tax=Trametes versicolor (strain FP-101664) TaxID=717944 RepID=UPI000462203A|nr:Clavaminate synthase-like protein [Trametes versicolor FP-101664 SS1]EIW55671.1 Clavaminate synthase-like protein [Trametes versicolor FP-101664 SS1]
MTLPRVGVRPQPRISTSCNFLRQHRLVRLSRTFANISGSDRLPLDGHHVLTTRPVPEAPDSLASSPQAFLEYLRSPTAAPLLLRAHTRPQNLPAACSRAETLLGTLRAAGDRLVEVEVGRYDKATTDSLGTGGRVDAPLSVYLEWLTGAQGAGAVEGERMQLYLAQWRARDEVPGLAEVVQVPSLLDPLLENHVVDLYQSSFFIGPSSTITPLHYDPYFNLYNVYASSDPSVHAKHFVLLPPDLSESLSRADGSVLRNTSPVDLHLRADSSENAFDVLIDPSTAPVNTREALSESGGAMSCVLREGDTLFVPRKWWHRVENVRLQDTATPGWTAGVGWWFLPRNS